MKLEDLRQHDGSDIETDVCVIGGGPAGIAMARAFANTRHRVCLFETGGIEPNVDGVELSRTTYGDNDYSTMGCRPRVLGGATSHWGGWSVPFDPWDFDTHDWITDSGWPIAFEEVERWYPEASEFVLAGENDFVYESLKVHRPGLGSFETDLLRTIYWRYPLLPTELANRWRPELETAPNIRVFLNASITSLEADDNAASVREAKVTYDGKSHTTVRARVYVVAAGAMDSTRLLLASNSVQSAGLGNGSDQLGRYFMMHPHVDIGEVQDIDSSLAAFYNPLAYNDINVIPGLAPTLDSMRTEKILNGSVRLEGAIREGDGWVAAKAANLALENYRFARRYDLDPGDSMDEFREQLWVAMKDLDGVIKGLMARSRGESYFGESASGARLVAQTEQAPNPDSRLVLDDETDSQGMRRLRQEIRVLPIDKATLRVMGELIARDFGQANLGRVKLEEWLYDDEVPWIDSMWGGCHHIGGTRMTTAAATGVVNTDCRLHTVDNVYVASSSVFPTGSYANPTMTIVALTLRLAEHLRDKVLV